jgi:hypothetical protein
MVVDDDPPVYSTVYSVQPEQTGVALGVGVGVAVTVPGLAVGVGVGLTGIGVVAPSNKPKS